MVIELPHGLVIRADSGVFTLSQRVVIAERDPGAKGKGRAPKPENIGSERDRNLGYYSSLTNVLVAACERFTATGLDTADLKALLAKLEEIKAAISEGVEKIIKAGVHP